MDCPDLFGPRGAACRLRAALALVLVATSTACGSSNVSSGDGDGGGTPSVDADLLPPDAALPDAAVPPCDGDAGAPTPPAAHGTYFTPVDMPTPMVVEPPAERALLSCAINGQLDAIGTSEYHEFFILDGKLWAIGGNRGGEMGLGDANPSPHVTPQAVDVPDEVRFRAVAAGGYQSLAADRDGYVWTWGTNAYGARGDGTLTVDGNDPSQGVPVKLTVDKDGAPFGGPADPVVQVLSSLWFQLARTASGQLYVWGLAGDDGTGNDARGILGDGAPIVTGACTRDGLGPTWCYQTRPVHIPLPDGVQIRHVAASTTMILALDADGQLWSWGGGGNGGPGLGVGPRDVDSQSSTPLHLAMGRTTFDGALGALPRFVDASTNTTTNYAVDEDGQLWGWGGDWMLLGVGSAEAYTPQPYPLKLTGAGHPRYAALDAHLAAGHKILRVQVSLNSAHVLVDDGTLWGWGDAAMGEVGDGHIVNYLSVTTNGQGEHVIGAAWDWRATRLLRPAARVLGEVAWFETSAISFHTMAVRRDGTIYSWGRNANGVLGDGLLTSDTTAPWFDQYAPVAPSSYMPNLYDVPLPTWVQPF